MWCFWPKDRARNFERRRHVRYAGDGLAAVIAGRTVAAADISLGGLRLADMGGLAVGTVIALDLLAPAGSGPHAPVVTAHAQATVLGVGPAGVRLAFIGQDRGLAYLVRCHVRRQRQRDLLRPNGR